MKKGPLYPKHTIGEHIAPFDLVFHKKDTVQKTLSTIQRKIGSWPNTENIFAIDKNRKLVGTVEFRELLKAKPQDRLEKIVDKNFRFLTDHSHQATAIKLAVKEGIESIPVTDQNGHFIGIIDAGQIFKIMHEEHIERLMHFSGILNSEALVNAYRSRVGTSVRSRLPWLLLGLAGGIATTFVIQAFDHTLQKELALAFFIPLVVYLNAAVGYQTQTIFVRYSSLEKVDLKKALFYELKVAIILALVLSLTILFIGLLWLGLKVSQIVALSIFIGTISSVLLGTLIPWFLTRAGKDPAIGSGPFTTIIQDLISVLIYFSIASALL